MMIDRLMSSEYARRGGVVRVKREVWYSQSLEAIRRTSYPMCERGIRCVQNASHLFFVKGYFQYVDVSLYSRTSPDEVSEAVRKRIRFCADRATVLLKSTKKDQMREFAIACAALGHTLIVTPLSLLILQDKLTKEEVQAPAWLRFTEYPTPTIPEGELPVIPDLGKLKKRW